MSVYVDGFVLPLRRDKLEEYKAMSEKASKIWKEHGALEYRECVGDDLEVKDLLPFPTMAQAGPDETVVLAYITYQSREQRDEVTAKVMADPRIAEICPPGSTPFDCKKMAYGGFTTLVYA